MPVRAGAGGNREDWHRVAIREQTWRERRTRDLIADERRIREPLAGAQYRKTYLGFLLCLLGRFAKLLNRAIQGLDVPLLGPILLSSHPQPSELHRVRLVA